MVNFKDLIDPTFILSITLYITFLLLYYFKGLKSDKKDQKGDYNDLSIFVTIILYVYNIYLFYSYTTNKDADFNELRIVLQVGLFYILNLIVIYTYFNPLEQGKTLTVDPSGNTLEYVYKDNKLGIFLGIAIGGLIALILGTITVVPQFAKFLPAGWMLTLIKIILVLFTFFGLIFATLYLFLYTPWPLTLVISILNIGILIGLLAGTYFLLQDFFGKSKDAGDKASWFRLIKLLIFYIPCLFIDLINYIKGQYGLTTSTTWLILLIEIITIGLRILVPFLYKQASKLTVPGGDLIEKGPIYTNTVTDLGVFQNHKSNLDPSKLNKKAIFNYNYALSCWIWVNPQPASTNDSYSKSTTLLNYGNVLKINFNKNKIEIFAATTEDNILVEQLVKIYELENIPYQKWNNFILNYNGGTLDIFINDKLVSSTINITPVMYYNKILAGADNGIYGGIKEIIYYDKVLTKRQINAIYNKQ